MYRLFRRADFSDTLSLTPACRVTRSCTSAFGTMTPSARFVCVCLLYSSCSSPRLLVFVVPQLISQTLLLLLTSQDDLVGETIVDLENRLLSAYRATCALPKTYTLEDGATMCSVAHSVASFLFDRRHHQRLDHTACSFGLFS